MLFFYDRSKVDWEMYLDKGNIVQYMEILESLGIGPEGQLTKLKRVFDVLKYLKLAIRRDDVERHQALEEGW